MKRFLDHNFSAPALAEKEESDSKKRKIDNSKASPSSSSSSTAVSAAAESALIEAKPEAVIGFNQLPIEIKVAIFQLLDMETLFKVILGFGKANYQIIITPSFNIIDFSHEFWLNNPLQIIPSKIQARIFAEQTQEINHFSQDNEVMVNRVKAVENDQWSLESTRLNISRKAYKMLLRSFTTAVDLPNTLTKANLHSRHRWLNQINIWLYQMQARLKYKRQYGHEFSSGPNLFTRLPHALLNTELTLTFSENPSWWVSLIESAVLKYMHFRQNGYWQNLQVLNLSRQHLSALPNLKRLIALKNLNLSYNQITQLPPLPLALETLDVSHNQITLVSALPSSLIELNIADNCLKHLPFDLPMSIQRLDLRQNYLQDLPFLSYERPILYNFQTTNSLSWLGTLDTQKAQPPGNNAIAPKLN